jgi:hypothetical protein
MASLFERPSFNRRQTAGAKNMAANRKRVRWPLLKADFAASKFDEATHSFILLAYLQKP